MIKSVCSLVLSLVNNGTVPSSGVFVGESPNLMCSLRGCLSLGTFKPVWKGRLVSLKHRDSLEPTDLGYGKVDSDLAPSKVLAV